MDVAEMRLGETYAARKKEMRRMIALAVFGLLAGAFSAQSALAAPGTKFPGEHVGLGDTAARA